MPGVRQRVVAALALLAGSGWALASSVTILDAQGQPVANAVVSLQSPQAAKAVRASPTASLAQRDRQFVPSVLAIPRGTPVQFPNQDTVRHHVYSFSPIKRFEIKLYVGTPANPVVFDQAGVAVLGCNIHDDMVAWVVVLDTPYFAITQANGVAQLPAAPADDYVLRVWHAGLPLQTPGHELALPPASSPPATLTVRLPG